MAWECGRGHPGQSEPLRLEEVSDIVGRKSTHVTGTVLRQVPWVVRLPSPCPEGEQGEELVGDVRRRE
jgi:hypothetical protein